MDPPQALRNMIRSVLEPKFQEVSGIWMRDEFFQDGQTYGLLQPGRPPMADDTVWTRTSFSLVKDDSWYLVKEVVKLLVGQEISRETVKYPVVCIDKRWYIHL